MPLTSFINRTHRAESAKIFWMAQLCQHHTNKWVTSEIALGVLFLACGSAIYLLFRSKALNIYQWCSAIGLSSMIDSLRNFIQDWNVSEFVKFSLPDGLYCAAYILIIDAIWHNDKGLIKSIIISLVPFITISSEILQYIGLVKGTFDKYDLICYIVPLLIYLSIKSININMFNLIKTKKRMKKYFLTMSVIALFAIGFAASDENYSDDFEQLEELLPENGSSSFVVYDQTPYGDKNRMLQLIVFYEKDNNRDIRIEGIESNGTPFSLEGKWAKGTRKETFQAKDYEYFWFWVGNDNFYVDKDLNIYYDESFLSSAKDIAQAFNAGVIGKLKKCASEEDAKKELEKINQKTKKTEKREDNISLLEGKEKEMAIAGYNRGKMFGMAGTLDNSFAAMRIISENSDKLGDKFQEMVVEMAGSQYDNAYNTPTNTKQERLKKIYVKYFIRGFNETII